MLIYRSINLRVNGRSAGREQKQDANLTCNETLW